MSPMETSHIIIRAWVTGSCWVASLPTWPWRDKSKLRVVHRDDHCTDPPCAISLSRFGKGFEHPNERLSFSITLLEPVARVRPSFISDKRVWTGLHFLRKQRSHRLIGWWRISGGNSGKKWAEEESDTEIGVKVDYRLTRCHRVMVFWAVTCSCR